MSDDDRCPQCEESERREKLWRTLHSESIRREEFNRKVARNLLAVIKKYVELMMTHQVAMSRVADVLARAADVAERHLAEDPMPDGWLAELEEHE